MAQDQPIEQAQKIKAKYEQELLKLANVVGVGVGYKVVGGQPTNTISIVANVTAKKPLGQLAWQDIVPVELDGMLTDVQEVGRFKAY